MTKRWAILAAALTLGLYDTAAASPIYPGGVKEALGLSRAPECTLCHRDNRGGEGTAIKPFAKTLIGFGLTGNAKKAKLLDALGELEAAESDSDGDGLTDIEELKDGTNPNTTESGSADDDPDAGDDADSGGCRLSPRSGTGSAVFVLLAAFGAVFWRRQSPGSRQGPSAPDQR